MLNEKQQATNSANSWTKRVSDLLQTVARKNGCRIPVFFRHVGPAGENIWFTVNIDRHTGIVYLDPMDKWPYVRDRRGDWVEGKAVIDLRAFLMDAAADGRLEDWEGRIARALAQAKGTPLPGAVRMDFTTFFDDPYSEDWPKTPEREEWFAQRQHRRDLLAGIGKAMPGGDLRAKALKARRALQQEVRGDDDVPF